MLHNKGSLLQEENRKQLYPYLCFVSLLYSSMKLFCIVARYRSRAKEHTPRPFSAGSNMAKLLSLSIVSSQNSCGTCMPPKPATMHRQYLQRVLSNRCHNKSLALFELTFCMGQEVVTYAHEGEVWCCRS